MQVLRIVLFSAAIAGSMVVHADAPIDAAQLGHMKGLVDVCGRVAPRDASQYLLQLKATIGDASRETVAQVSRSQEYQQAYQAVSAELKGMAPDEMARACSAYLVPLD